VNALLTLVGGSLLGLTVGSLLVPITRRELAAAVSRSVPPPGAAADTPEAQAAPRVTKNHWAALALVSGLLPAYVLHRVGWCLNALPPLLLLVGLVQLAYCDLRRRLLPKTLVYALSVAVIASGVIIALSTGERGRLVQASLGGVVSFALFFIVNLMNPRWMGFGDVRLSLVFGFGLAWVSPIDLFEAFLFANLLALGAGVALLASHRADRGSALPFGLFMALGTALVLVT
jgi:prepilin signal peptidase PulO-like enzyme (type II secretory pathway)